MRRRAFTLIEVMVAVALIAILGSLLVVGVAHLQTNSKRQQTHLIMQNLSAMFAEYDVARRVPFGMGHLNFGSIVAANQNAVLDAICMPCPADVTPVTATLNDRYGIAVQYTRDFMSQLISMPNNAAAIGKLSAGSLMTFLGPNQTSIAWSAATIYGLYPHTPATLASLADDSTATFTYARTQVYSDSTGNLLPDAPSVNAPPNYYFWMPVVPVPATATSPLSTPVALDAWGNPILFVMGGVLGERPSGGATAGFLVAGGNNFQVVSPDYRPFFASAGPDGNFSLGDDNIYSFEK